MNSDTGIESSSELPPSCTICGTPLADADRACASCGGNGPTGVQLPPPLAAAAIPTAAAAMPAPGAPNGEAVSPWAPNAPVPPAAAGVFAPPAAAGREVSPWAPNATTPLVSPPPMPTPGGATWTREHGWLQTAPLAPPSQPPGVAPTGAPIGPPPAYPVTSGPPPFEQIPIGSTRVSPGRGRKLAAATAAVGIGATALVGFAFVATGDSTAGGADSPEAAVTKMAEAINDGDALAAVGFVAPDELSGADTFVEKLIPYVAELSDEFGGDAAGEETSFDIDIEAVDVRADDVGDHAAIVSFAVVGEATVDVGDASWIGGPFFGYGSTDDGEYSTEFDTRRQGDGFDGDDFELVTVQLDGKWYISPFLSAGHAWVEDEYLPAGDYELVGQPRDGASASPIAAVERYFDMDDWTEAADVAEVLGGGEGRFFHVFADALDASGLFSDGGFDETFDVDIDYTLTEIGDGRVEVDDVAVSVDDDYGSDFTFEFSDGCGTIGDQWDRVSGCFSELFPPDAEVDDRLWLQTVEEDGGHRVVVLPTLFEMMSRFVGPYDAETIRWATNSAHSDDPRPAAMGEQLDIDFAGRRYVVYEFATDDGMEYTVEVTGDHEYTIYAGNSEYGGFYETWDRGDGVFHSYGDDVARVVVFSEVVDGCRGFECVPSGRGATSLTVTASEIDQFDQFDQFDQLDDIDFYDDVDVLDDVDDELPDDWYVPEDLEDPETYDDEVVVVEADVEVGDPRVLNPTAWTQLDVEGPTTWSTALPAGEFELSTFAVQEVLDTPVTVVGTECTLNLNFFDTCKFEHGGGPLDVLIAHDGNEAIRDVLIYLRAVERPRLTVLDERVASLAAQPGAAPPVTVFDDVAPGGVLVVASGTDRQDITLTVDGHTTCRDVDHGLDDGEICYIDHPGGPLGVVVEGWSEGDRSGEAIITLETAA